ncbi:UNVERIFIED_CONTAM: hypothetical protein FKN15_036410 [Acipenser sinensis]
MERQLLPPCSSSATAVLPLPVLATWRLMGRVSWGLCARSWHKQDTTALLYVPEGAEHPALELAASRRSPLLICSGGFTTTQTSSCRGLGPNGGQLSKKSGDNFTVLTPMQTVIQETIEYTRQRKIFNQPILHNQTVHFRLAELETEVELLRSLLYRATAMYVNGTDVTKLASMAKLKAGRLARELSDSCLQFWGGMGFTSDVFVSRFYRGERTKGHSRGFTATVDMNLGTLRQRVHSHCGHEPGNATAEGPRPLWTRTWECYGRGSTATVDMNLGMLWQRVHGHCGHEPGNAMAEGPRPLWT